MKLALQKNQVLALCIAGVGLMAGLVWAWCGIGLLVEKTELAQQLAERRGKSEVANLLDRPGGISEAKKEIAEFEKFYSQLSKDDESLLGPWRQASQEAAGFGKNWAKDPNQWKDMLVSYNDEIAKKAGKIGDRKKVVLSGNFYLGLERFKQLSPTEDMIPALAVQMSVSKRLVDLLFSVKEKTHEGYPTTCTLIKLQGPLGQGEERPLEAKAQEKSGEKGIWQRDSYTIELECSPEVLYAYMSALVKDTWLFLPVNLNIENERSTFPKRSQLAEQFAPANTEASAFAEPRKEGSPVAPPLLLVLVGKEKVRANLQVDFISLKFPLPAKTASSNSQP